MVPCYAMLDWDELLSIELKGDNIEQFLSDWESTLLGISGLPDAKFLETLFRRQLDKSEQLKNAMSLYWQDITQGGESKFYDKRQAHVYFDTSPR